MVKQHGDEKMRVRLQNWLKDPNTPVYRFGLIGLMLGLCGKPEDGALFLATLNDPDKSVVSGVDGILAGYILVDREHGWKYTQQLLSSPDKDFSKRYAALRTARFLWDTHIGHVPAEEILEAVAKLLEQGDIADLAIEDLRKWKQWQFTDKILRQSKRDTHSAPIIHRAVLRYMISCPQDRYPAAKAYVDSIKKSNPEKVQDALELLELEKSMQAAPADASKKP
jgi:DNA-binding ferritin-like protein (Dps family)